jgi:hypothetical protein
MDGSGLFQSVANCLGLGNRLLYRKERSFCCQLDQEKAHKLTLMEYHLYLKLRLGIV